MRIACLQFAPQVGEVNNNLNRADAVLNRANPEDLDLLVLPEMAFSGYNFKSLRDIAPFLEPSGSGISSLWARTTALKYNCVVVVGYPEKVDVSQKWPTSPEYYNSAIVVNEEGETIANYRKTHLYYTDETWALESPKGFFRGYIEGLGHTAMGICMDINPYRFQTSWDAFEFGYHILHSEANLVIISMAWLTQQDAGDFSRMPQEPDMETLTYWATRLEPVIRAEDVEDEIIVVFCNRTGNEDEAVYAGTSAVIGILDGEVSVYGLLGRGDKELLVVDTDQPPFAKMVLRPTEEATPADNAEASPISAEPAVPESTHDPTASTSGRSSGEHRVPRPIKDNNPEAFYKADESRSSSPVDPGDYKASKKPRPLPPKLQVPQQAAKTWKRSGSDEVFVESTATDLPTPSGPSPTPSSGRPKLGLPISKWAAGQAQHISTSPEAGPSPGRVSHLPNSGIAMSPSDLSDERFPPQNKRSQMPRLEPTPIDPQPQPVDYQVTRHRRTNSKGSEMSRSSRNCRPTHQEVRFSDDVEEMPLRNTSFARLHADRTARFQDSPKAHPPDAEAMSGWLDALPYQDGVQENIYFGSESMAQTRYISYKPTERILEQVVEHRLSTASRDSIVIAASPSVLQTAFHRPFAGIVMGDEPVDSDTTASFAQTLGAEPGTYASEISSQNLDQAVLGYDYQDQHMYPDVELSKIEIPQVIEEKSRERPASFILSPIEPSNPSQSLPVPGLSSDKAPRFFDEREVETHEKDIASEASIGEQSAEDSTDGNWPISDSKWSPHSTHQPDLVGIKRISPQCPIHGHAIKTGVRHQERLAPVATGQGMTKLVLDDPNPSPASFVSSVETLSPSNEVPPTPLDVEGPPTPKAMMLGLDDMSDTEMSTLPLSPTGQIQLKQDSWSGTPRAPLLPMSRPKSVVW